MTHSLKNEMYVNGSWLDVSSDTQAYPGISIVRGGTGESGRFQVSGSLATFQLLNTRNNYSPLNPMGIYYPHLTKNVPNRVSVYAGDRFLLTSNLDNTSPEHAAVAAGDSALSITGDIDIRVNVSLLKWSASNLTLARKYNATGNQRSWMFYMTTAGYLVLKWSTDGTSTNEKTATSTAVAPWWTYTWFRVTLDVNNGASGYDAKFYVSTDGTTWTQVGGTVTGTSTTSIFDSTASLYVGGRANVSTHESAAAHWHKFQLYSGIAGAAVANPDFTAQSEGATSFTDAAGTGWTVQTTYASITNRRIRHYGTVASIAPRRDTTGKLRLADVQSAGVLRRIGADDTPLKSAIYREMMSAGRTRPKAYWTLEDGSEARTIGSPIEGCKPMSISGSPTLSSSDVFLCSAALPVMNSARFLGRVPAYKASGTKLIMRVLVYVPSSVGGTKQLVGIRCTGTANLWQIWVDTNGDLTLTASDAEGTEILDTGALGHNIHADPIELKLELTTSGANTGYALGVRTLAANGTSSASEYTGTLNNYLPGIARRVSLGYDKNLADVVFGHLTIADDTDVYTNLESALEAWQGETAGARLIRLCDEEGLSFVGVGDMADTVEMGAQRPNTLNLLLTQCMESDGGFLYETKWEDGLSYRNRKSLYNLTTRLTIDYSANQIRPAGEFEPEYDDFHIANEVVVTREGGSSYQLQETSGPLSVEDPPKGVGVYNLPVQVSLLHDVLARDAGGYRLHLGTWDAIRAGRVPMMLHEDTTLYEEVAELDFGDRFIITNLPSDMPPDDMELMLVGYNEFVNQVQWEVTPSAVPEGPYHVAVVEDTTLGRVDTDGMQIYTMPTKGDSQENAASADFMTLSDAEAAGFAVGAKFQIVDSNGAIRMSSSTTDPVAVFTVTSKDSAFGFTRMYFTPNCETTPTIDDRMYHASETSLGVISGWVEAFEDANYIDGLDVGDWERTTTSPQAGLWCLKSNDISDSETTEVTLTIPEGAESIQFYYRTDCEATNDYIEFLVDSTSKFTASGTGGSWTQSASYSLVNATTCTWKFVKNGSTSSGADAVYIDFIVISGNWPKASTAAADYTTNAVLDIGGEKVSVSAVADVSGKRQTLTATRAGNGIYKAHLPGTPVRLWQPTHMGM